MQDIVWLSEKRLFKSVTDFTITDTTNSAVKPASVLWEHACILPNYHCASCLYLTDLYTYI